MPKPKPCCQSLHPWLKANLGPHCLAPLTGTDAKALAAAVHVAELYGYHRDNKLLVAFGLIVSTSMQPHTMELAYHAIAHVLDWSDRAAFWAAAGLPIIELHRCAAEPGGSLWQTSVSHTS